MPATRTTEEIVAHINDQFSTFSASMNTAREGMDSLGTRIVALEQAFAANRNGAGGMLNAAAPRGWGAQVAEHARFKAFVEAGRSGKVSIPITASITTPTGIEQRDLAPPQRDPIQPLPAQALTVRSLITALPTANNLIQYVRQTSRTIGAAPVADGDEKPESSMGLELAESAVRTLAHWTYAPKQSLDDIPDLENLIDNDLLFGLGKVEEDEVLFGDGSGQHLLGIVPQALPFSPPFTVADENPLDRVLQAIAQANQARLGTDAVLLNDLDFAALVSLKDSTGRYLATGGGPWGTIANLLWQVRYFPTASLARGECLVGAFRLGARLYDRQEATVELSTEDRDNFIKNLVTIRAERRTALAVKVPDSFVYISDLDIPGST